MKNEQLLINYVFCSSFQLEWIVSFSSGASAFRISEGIVVILHPVQNSKLLASLAKP